MFNLWNKAPTNVGITGHDVTVSVNAQVAVKRLARNKQRLVRIKLALIGLEARAHSRVITTKMAVLSREARILEILTEEV